MKKKLILFFLVIFCCSSYPENMGWVNSFKGVNLRTSPDLSGKILSLIPEAESVQILIVDKTRKAIIDGFPDYWMNIKYGKLSGWAFGAYISDVKILSENEFKKQND